MKTPLLFLIICVGIFIYPNYLLAQNIGVIGKLGAMSFVPGRFDSEFSENWGTMGIFYGGEVALETTSRSEISLELSFIKAGRTTEEYMGAFWGRVPASTETNLTAVMASMRLIHPANFYLMLGVGQIMMKGRVGIAFFSQDVAETDFAFQVGIGENLTEFLRAEIKYLYGGRNGNSGIIIWLGPKFNL